MRALLCSPERVEKIIVNMVNCDHDIRDTVVRVTDPWDKSKDEHGSIPIIWNLDSDPHGEPYLPLILRRS